MVNIELFFPIIAIGAFAISSAIIRDLDRIGSPIYLNMLRATVGALAFLIVVVITGSIKDIFVLGVITVVYLVLSVFFNVVIGDTLYFYAQNTLGIKIATPIVNIYPFVTVLFSYIFLDESLSIDFFIGGFLIILGVMILSQDVDTKDVEIENLHEHKKLVLIAFIAAIGAILCYALGVIFTTVGSTDVDTNVANSIRMPAASFFLGSATIIQIKTKNEKSQKVIKVGFTDITNKDKIKIFVSGILGTFISSFFLVLSTQELGAGKTAILLSIGPVFSLPLAIFWLKEKLGVLTVIGTLLSLFGLMLIIT